MTKDYDLTFSCILKRSFPFMNILKISQNLPNLDIQEFISLAPWFNTFSHLIIVETPPPPKKSVLDWLKVDIDGYTATCQKWYPLDPLLYFFLSQATQRFTQLDLKLFSRFQNCLGNCQREYTNVGVTVRANVTARARQAPSYPPDGSVALGCVIWSSNATCPRPHELVN